MATQDDLSFYICSVCFERYTVPRRLPACSHSFCEECLFQYITNLGENVATPDELPCPLCRSVTPFPSNTEDIKGWISSLELDNELAQNVETEKQKDMPDLCQRCKEDNRPVLASIYCFECQEYLCMSCCKIGHGFKVMRGHSILEIKQENYDTRQKGFLKTMSDYVMCERHREKKLTFICVEEDTLCCEICKDMFHYTCKNVTEISKCTSKDKIIEQAPKLKEKLSKLSEIGKIIIQRKNKNEASNKEDTGTILEKIQDIRRNMNLVFDALEERVHQQCKGLTKECALADHEDIAKLQELVQTFETLNKLLDSAVSLAPQDLVFIVLHELLKSVEKHETAILEFRQSFKKFGFELKLDQLLQNIEKLNLNNVDSLAEISLKTTEVELPKVSDRQLFRYCKIEKASLPGFYTHKKLPELNLSGMTTLPDDHLFLVDASYGSCYLFDSKYKETYSRYLTKPADSTVVDKLPRSVCYMKNNVLAVSWPKVKKICFIRAQPEGLEITGEIHTRFQPMALNSLKNGDIAVSWFDPVGFGILAFHQNYTFNEKIYFNRDQSGRIMKSFLYMAVDEERKHVLQPCEIDKALFCFDFAGAPKFTYKHPELTRPLGVTTDPDGAIYVCDTDHDCIHIVSPFGELVRIIRDGIPTQPSNVLYKSKAMEIVVANLAKPRGVFIFKVTAL